MNLFKWVGLARVLIRAEKSLARLADATERLADAAEGHPRRWSEVEAPKEATVDYLDVEDAVRIEAIEERLTRTLGRAPDAEEIVRELDGQEYGEEDGVLRGR